ncbi:MAG: PKD-like family lipoprotein [Bacteroides sp.]|nr:PKD-like family lipoprotein [Bacteroides sp.]
MKKIILSFCSLLVLYACIEDRTNESLVPLNEIIIGGVDDEYLHVSVDQIFRVSPTIKISQGSSDELTYLWITYTSNSRLTADTLSKEKDLAVPIRLTPGKHTLKLKVTDERTGVFYEKESTIHVVNEFTAGVLILAEVDGHARLDFLKSTGGDVVTDVYGKMNKGDLLGKNPRKVVFNKFRTDLLSEVLVMCDDEMGGKVLDNITLVRRKNYRELFFASAPDGIMKPQTYYSSSMRGYLIDNGRVYDRAVNTNPPAATVKPSMIAESTEYEISANADFGDNEKLPSRMVLYDNLNGCFYSLHGISSVSLSKVGKTSGFSYINGGFFNPNELKMKCLYAGITSRSESGVREYLGVFEDAQGKRRLLSMRIGFFTSENPASFFQDLGNTPMQSPGITEATSFATSAQLPGYLFYAVGGKLYLYNAINHLGHEVYDLGNGYLVDHIEADRGTKCLWVAFRNTDLTETQAGFCGLKVSTDGGLSLEQTIRQEGLADRIVDFERKY